MLDMCSKTDTSQSASTWAIFSTDIWLLEEPLLLPLLLAARWSNGYPPDYIPHREETFPPSTNNHSDVRGSVWASERARRKEEGVFRKWTQSWGEGTWPYMSRLLWNRMENMPEEARPGFPSGASLTQQTCTHPPTRANTQKLTPRRRSACTASPTGSVIWWYIRSRKALVLHKQAAQRVGRSCCCRKLNLCSTPAALQITSKCWEADCVYRFNNEVKLQ